MIAEAREEAESLDRERGRLFTKVKSYLRGQFPLELSMKSPEAVRSMALQVAQDWCLNRGVRMREEDLKNIVNEAFEEHCREGADGNDPRGKPLGTRGQGFTPSYTA